MERKWDNEGAAALELPQQEVVADAETGEGASSSYVNMNDPNKVVGQAFHHSGARDLVRVRTDDTPNQQYHPDNAASAHTDTIQSFVAAQYYGTEGVPAQLEAAFPVPKIMLIGLGLWSFSFWLDPEIGGLRFYANFFNISCFVLAALVGPLLAFPMRKAILERDVQYEKKIDMALILIAILISSFSIADPEVDAPWYFTIVASE
jgi:hypothetical protein